MAELLRMEGISKSFPGVQALKDVHFEVQSGEVHALIGENGAGKSTLMKCLTGIYVPEEGTMTFKGEPWKVSNPKEATDKGISIIHQELNLMNALTVAQNIFIGREPRKMSFVLDDKKMRRETLKLMERIDFYLDPDAIVGTLTVAQMQMVEILRSLVVDTDILVLDEPTSSLTSAEVDKLFTIIRGLRDAGKGIVYISHRLEEFDHIVDKVTVLRDGQYVNTKLWKETTINEMIASMVGREMTEQFPERHAEIGEVVLEAKNIVRGKVLKNCSMYVRRGEVLGMAGLMGAGRTELARAIYGADKIDSGEVFINGKKVNIHNPKDAVKLGIAYLSEDRKRDGLMLDQDVSFNTYIANLDKYSKGGVVNDKDIRKTVGEFVEALSIKTPSLQQLTQFLSGGNQQKVLVARWLCKKSDIIFFDEPTRGIDVGSKYEIYCLINELAENGAAVVMITSEMAEILGMSDRIMVMYEGTVVGELSAEEANQEIVLHMASNTHRLMEEK
ncbi:MAG: sugar ABC transporter ATP-binding protein [Clostridiales bacterium]|nr:sugar ABC transporter ATP-binding protein [Clostridiales bacterium]